MHILANFVIFDDFGPFLIEKWTFWPFWGPLTASCPKVTIYLPLTPWTLSGPAQNPVILTKFDHFGTPFEGPEGGWLGPQPNELPLGWRTCFGALTNPCLGPQILAILTTFPIESQFCHFAYQRSVKMPFWPYFDPILSPPKPKFLALAKMCLFVPFYQEGPWRTKRDPILTLILTILTPLRVLREAAAKPPAELPLGWRTCSEPLKPVPRTLKFWSFWPLWPPVRPQEMTSFWPFWHFKPHNLAIWVQIGPFGGTWPRPCWRKCQFWPILVIFPIEKSQFCHFAYQRSVKCHFDPILTPFWALLSLNFGPGQNVPICSLCPEGPWGTLEGPQIWPDFDHFGPLWGSWGGCG